MGTLAFRLIHFAFAIRKPTPTHQILRAELGIVNGGWATLRRRRDFDSVFLREQNHQRLTALRESFQYPLYPVANHFACSFLGNETA
jgi:hypothetical protein